MYWSAVIYALIIFTLVFLLVSFVIIWRKVQKLYEVKQNQNEKIYKDLHWVEESFMNKINFIMNLIRTQNVLTEKLSDSLDIKKISEDTKQPELTTDKDDTANFEEEIQISPPPAIKTPLQTGDVEKQLEQALINSEFVGNFWQFVGIFRFFKIVFRWAV